MALTNAERQRRFRKRHLLTDRLSMVINSNATAALRRLARYHGKTQRALLEQMLLDAERKAADACEDPRDYYDGPQPEPAPLPANVSYRRPRDGERAFTGEWEWVVEVDGEPLLGLQRGEHQGWRGRYLKPSMTWRWCKRHKRCDVVADLLASADVYR